MDPERIRVDELLFDGTAKGIGEGRPAIVRGALPGELVGATIEHVKKNGHALGVTTTVHRASPARVDVDCPVFLTCGGCDLLHADLETQHELKRRRVAEALSLPLDRVDPVVASPRTTGYRALAKLVVGPARILGSYSPRSHDVVDMTGCVVHAPEVERVVDAIRAIVRRPKKLDLRYVLVRASMTDGRAVVTLISSNADGVGIDELIEPLAALEDVAVIAHHVNGSEGNSLIGDGGFDVRHFDGEVVERIGEVEQSIAPGAFNQVNAVGAAQLYRTAVEAMGADGPILDLYAGSGGLSLSFLAAGASRVTSIETHSGAVEAARSSAKLMGVADRLHANEGAVEAWCERFDGHPRVVVNPPRKGLSHQVAAALGRADWGRLVYVSCNPDTLARDVELLRGTIERVTPVDLFVHTRHVEIVLTLSR